MKESVPVRVVRVFSLIEKLMQFPPKRIDALADRLNVSTSTVYKDIEVVRSIGMPLERDSRRRYYFSGTREKAQAFTLGEKKEIISALKLGGLSAALLSKLKLKLGLETLSDSLEYAHVARQVSKLRMLTDAVEGRRAVLLRGYRSLSSDNLSQNRTVFPLYLDEQLMAIYAYVPEKSRVQIFKIHRMDSIELVDNCQSSKLPEDLPEIDAFGMAGRKVLQVSLLLSKRAATLLNEEHEMARDKLSIYGGDAAYDFRYDDTVCAYEGIGRFVLGLLHEIKVESDDGLKKYLASRIALQKIL
ncbi:MAG TPA: HTH domain-containing protein [Saprospiraceae bacterium]|nr:HTH domain-containing protein [Saprospiraceae bacterium]